MNGGPDARTMWPVIYNNCVYNVCDVFGINDTTLLGNNFDTSCNIR